MSIKSTIFSEIERLAEEEAKQVPPLREEMPLLELSGLDSLAIAILVARLEEKLGLDPFTDSGGYSYPVTLGEFIKAYENAAKS